MRLALVKVFSRNRYFIDIQLIINNLGGKHNEDGKLIRVTGFYAGSCVVQRPMFEATP